MARTLYAFKGIKGRLMVEGDDESIKELKQLLEYTKTLKSSLKEAIDILNDIPNTETRYGQTYDLIPKLEKALEGQQ